MSNSNSETVGIVSFLKIKVHPLFQPELCRYIKGQGEEGSEFLDKVQHPYSNLNFADIEGVGEDGSVCSDPPGYPVGARALPHHLPGYLRPLGLP